MRLRHRTRQNIGREFAIVPDWSFSSQLSLTQNTACTLSEYSFCILCAQQLGYQNALKTGPKGSRVAISGFCGSLFAASANC